MLLSPFGSQDKIQSLNNSIFNRGKARISVSYNTHNTIAGLGLTALHLLARKGELADSNHDLWLKLRERGVKLMTFSIYANNFWIWSTYFLVSCLVLLGVRSKFFLLNASMRFVLNRIFFETKHIFSRGYWYSKQRKLCSII